MHKKQHSLPQRVRFQAASGDKLFKHLTVKVIIGEKVMRHFFRAPAGKGYREEDIEKNIENVIDHLDKKFPMFEFKQVQVSVNWYNFIAIGARKKPEEQKDGTGKAGDQADNQVGAAGV